MKKILAGESWTGAARSRMLKIAHYLLRVCPVREDPAWGGYRIPEGEKRVRQSFDKHLRGRDTGPIAETPIQDEGPGGSPRSPR
jgi:hypothetical protein